MADSFFGFTDESFEQFARALAISIFGAGVTAFGAGRDKGREAIFRGTVNFPSPPASLWSGYGVIQAKCKLRSEGTKIDQKWAINQLEGELEAFAGKKRKLKPEYYIFVTNVHLSSAGKGWDEGDALIRSYYSKIPGLKDHRLWGASQIAGYLDSFEQLRRRFTAYLTSGDVLAALIRDIENRRPNAEGTLVAYLDSGLRADLSSRLDEAGNRTDEQLLLADLFFDLPASKNETLVPPIEKIDNDGNLPRGVLSTLLRNGSRRLDPETVLEQEAANEQSEKTFPTRYVLLGGFGSGKSTLAQFLAQIHRAAILDRRPAHELELSTRQAIAAIKTKCKIERLPWPTTPRYPFRVELSRFARALATGRAESLIHYLLIEVQGDRRLAFEVLREWLGAFPWLVILDGLDEVPATSNRTAVVAAVDNFLAEARRAGADLFVVATSRKDGYEGEFRSGVVEYMYISPLSRDRALRYVSSYSNARFGKTDPKRATDLLDKLQSSIRNDLTAQLMTTPLQVTFMATVVAARGDPGTDRWQLFSKYYQTIYDRERQKAVPPYDTVFGRHQAIIDRLHHDVGFWLQSRGEVAGQDAVSLPAAQFRELARVYLSDHGYEGTELDRLVDTIVGAAGRRLVFLTSRVEGELAFEVRGLQEYMASECLMTGNRELFRARILAIAPHHYWRNVFLFAVGKCFADAQSRHLQDDVRILCEDLNDSSGHLLSITKSGSALALAILEGGAVADNRAHARHLAKIMLELLPLAATRPEGPRQLTLPRRMAGAYRDHLKSVYISNIELYLGQTNRELSQGAWQLAILLTEQRNEQASALVKKYWPSDIAGATATFQACVQGVGLQPSLLAQGRAILPEMSPIVATKLMFDSKFSKITPTGIDWFDYMVDFLDRGFRLAARVLYVLRLDNIPGPPVDGLHLTITSFVEPESRRRHFEILAKMPVGHPGWCPLQHVASFLAAPNCATLASILRRCGDVGWTRDMWPSDLFSQIPWPMAVCLARAATSADLMELARLADAGALGDQQDWLAAETRWAQDGVTSEDVLSAPDAATPISPRIANIGFPFSVAGVSLSQVPYPTAVHTKLCELALATSNADAKKLVVWFIVLIHDDESTPITHPGHLRATQVVRDYGEIDFAVPISVLLYPTLQASSLAPDSEYLDYCDVIGRLAKSLRGVIDVADADLTVGVWQDGFISDPSRAGLVRLLAYALGSGHVIEGVPAKLLAPGRFSEQKIQLSAVLLGIVQSASRIQPGDELLHALARLLNDNVGLRTINETFNTLLTHHSRFPNFGDILLWLREYLPGAGPARDCCDRSIHQFLRSRISQLTDPVLLDQLQLPDVPKVIADFSRRNH
ncbi:Putative NTPase, NACHT family OS=Pseudomonas syringae pv. syringae B64 GN=PSSB64_0553 PE=4 SV=1 [Gemmataceae bacterium]|nr:Putative NTPase, NACHT family OS=Pseudomonas syringae pv. syringae B64 GN=PSSB64_0553 PE=4 SV=1 [Gemmataceae bacterium]VTT98878.1 Putative NTPase, NACHT family OS=Pseudomonas syringae pv. syringae B64 GN=PSSB64_0553 PE=4 SV=1 [Gemmataceae bacterium]